MSDNPLDRARDAVGEAEESVKEALGATESAREHLEDAERESTSASEASRTEAEELAGRVKEQVGDATDNRDLQAEGMGDQAATARDVGTVGHYDTSGGGGSSKGGTTDD